MADADPRVKSVLSLDSGLFDDGTLNYGPENLQKLHTPVLFLDGGPDDVAYPNTTANFAQATVPAVRATDPAADHVGYWYGLRNGDPDPSLREEAVWLLVNWLYFTLNGNRLGRSYFLGSGLRAVHATGVDRDREELLSRCHAWRRTPCSRPAVRCRLIVHTVPLSQRGGSQT